MASAQTTCCRDDYYRNWVKGSLGLRYLQEGLQTFAETVIQTEHRNVLQRIGTCGKCTMESILPAHAKDGNCIQKKKRCCNCTKKGKIYCAVCSKLYDEIIMHHRFFDPNWDIDATAFFSDHWQFAKSFMTTTTKDSNNTATETDAACLLSIIINSNFFQAELDTTIDGKTDIFSQAKQIRNTILHSSKLELTEDEVTRYLKIMKDVLQDKKVLLNDKAAQAAVENITRILNTKFIITTEIEKSATESALKSIKGAGELWEHVLKELSLRKQEITDAITADLLAKISQAREDAIDEIKKMQWYFKSDNDTGHEQHQDIPTPDQETSYEDRLYNVIQENKMILKDIAKICSKRTKHTENILLVGPAGSGKSALINTIHKAISGLKYFPMARCGYGNTAAITTSFDRFPNCGIMKNNVIGAYQQDFLNDVLPFLPNLIDSPPFSDAFSPEGKELLELVIRGQIPPGTNIKALCIQQEEYPGFLKQQLRFAESNPAAVISKILLVQSSRDAVPRGLIEMIKDVLQKIDEEYSIDVFVALTRYDLVHVDRDMYGSVQAEDALSLEDFERAENAISKEFNIFGMKENRMFRWASYCDRTGHDNPYIDNIALKFIARLM